LVKIKEILLQCLESIENVAARTLSIFRNLKNKDKKRKSESMHGSFTEFGIFSF